MSQCQNGAPPMFFPWTNVTVTLDQDARTRGIGVSIGTPPQVISLRPSTGDENLYVVNKAACSPSYNDTCVGAYGGVFNASASTSFHQVSEGQWNGTSDPDTGGLSLVYFNDVLTFENATVYGFPSSFDQITYGGQGALPLGWNSDFLKSVFSMGAVPSKAFAFWTGSRSVNFPVDGSLIVGGYDSTRFVGQPTTFVSNEQCPFCVVVTGLSYDTGTSSISLFSNASETLQIGLEPAQRVLYLTQDMFDKFTSATDGVWDDDLELLRYPADTPPTGNLTVTLSNGYNTTIPAEELFSYPRLYNDQGVYQVSNNTILIADVLNKTATPGYVYDWGIPYLTMNYVFADYARNQFQMAPAIRTDFQSQGGGYELVAVCDPTSVASKTTSSLPTATSHVSPVPTHHSGSNTGAIVGGVVGGVLGLILIFGGLGLLFYRSRRRRRSAPTAVAAETVVPPPSPPNNEKYLHDGVAGERVSQYPPASPTDVGELSSEGKGGAASVHQWLSSQDSETTTMSPKIDRPFEMPAGRYDSD